MQQQFPLLDDTPAILAAPGRRVLLWHLCRQQLAAVSLLRDRQNERLPDRLARFDKIPTGGEAQAFALKDPRV